MPHVVGRSKSVSHRYRKLVMAKITGFRMIGIIVMTLTRMIGSMKDVVIKMMKLKSIM